MSILDDRTTYQRLDTAGIGNLIAGLPQQCRAAWDAGMAAPLPERAGDVMRVVVAGMGGSAIGGALARGLADLESPVALTVCRDYRLPAWVDVHTLVIASSFSGNTEETLSCVEDALERHAPLLAITTGGKLAQIAQAHHIPALTYAFAGQPRCALGYGFVGLLALLQRAGIIGEQASDLEAAVRAMEAWAAEISPDVPEERNAAKQMARALHGRIPVVYGAGFLTDVAVRWKGQFNENSKTFAFAEALPEANHNAVEGYGLPAGSRERMAVVFLKSALLHPRVLDRIAVTADILERQGIPAGWVDARGDSALAHILTLVQFGDWVSYYLAMLNGQDPNPIPQIDYLKAQLAQR